MCFSERMRQLGLDTSRCLKHNLKCDTPSTYLLAAHSNLSTRQRRGLSRELTWFDVVWSLCFDTDS